MHLVTGLTALAASLQRYMPQQIIARILACTCSTVPAVVFASALTEFF